MDEEYLWDSTGDDPEIKRLEEALAGFRYREIAPPLNLPVTTAAAITGTKLSWRFSLPLAFAAVAIVVAIGGVWLFLGGRNAGVSEEISVVDPPTTITEVRAEPIVDPSFPSKVAQTPEHTKETGKPRFGSSDYRPQKLAARVVRTKQEVVLTPEEKDAYGRLLLALSITGSKLKIVSDTINRTDEDKTGRDPNNR